MLRVIGLTLVVVTGAAKVAHAESHYDGGTTNRIETALDHAPDTRQAALHGYQGARLQIGGGLGFSPFGQDHQRGSGHLDLARTERQERGRDGRRLARNRTAHGKSDSWLNFGASSKPTLGYAVNDSLSLGLGYRYQSNESMNFKVAKVGGLDSNYHSHSFMLEAHFEF